MFSRTSASAFRRLLVLTVLHFSSMAVLLLCGRWIRQMGGSESELGWFSASIVPGIILGAPLAGRLTARFGERRLILAGLIAVGTMTLGFAAFTQISWWLVPMRFLQGIGHGMVFTGLLSLTAHSIPDQRKAQGMGYFALCAQLGNMTGIALAENLLAPHGFAAVFCGGAVLAGLAFLGALTLPTFADSLPTAASNGSQGLNPTTGQIALTVAFFFVLGGSYGSVLQVLPLLVQDIARISGEIGRVTPVMATIFLTVAVARLFLARVADGRFRQPALIGSLLLLALASASWPLARSTDELIPIAAAFALGYGLLFPGLNGLVLTQVAGPWRARASGWIVMAFDGGFFGLLLALGPVAEHYSYRVMFPLLGLLQLASATLFLVMLRRLQRLRRANR